MKSALMTLLKKQPQLIILITMAITFYFLIPSFGTERNLLNILKTLSILGFTCLGLSVVMIGGNLDLSVGSTMSCLAVFSVKMQTVSPILGIIVPIIAAIGIGVLNGGLVYKFKINSIVVTLGTMSILSGLALLPSNSMSVQGVPGTWYSNISGIMFGPVPIYIVYFIVLSVVIFLLLTRTRFGRSLYYMGNNAKAAEIAGHNVALTTTLSFVICSLCVCFAAIIQSSRMLTANPIGGLGLEFEALTAVLLGGISLKGGKGSVLTALVGIFLLTIIANGMNLFGAAFEYQLMARGILILTAIIVDAITRYRYEK